MMTPLALVAAILSLPPAQPAPTITFTRVPERGIQPQVALAPDGSAHLLYFAGDPAGGDLFYAHHDLKETSFGPTIRVNSTPASAIATGTIRGGQLARGKDNAIHVVWNGAKGPDDAKPHENIPLWYTRLDISTGRFEPQRNIITHTRALDGGGTVAADPAGNVLISWHALDNDAPDNANEMARHVFAARSTDNGRTFARESPISPPALGACACCGMASLAASDGRAFILYRGAADDGATRSMTLLRSEGLAPAPGNLPSFTASNLHAWPLRSCPISSASVIGTTGRTDGPASTLLAWETKGQVYLARCSGDGRVSEPVAPPGEPGNRKHPRLATNASGQVVLTWVEGSGWKRGGSLAWQAFSPDMAPIAGSSGQRDGVPAWSFPAPLAKPDGSFQVIY